MTLKRKRLAVLTGGGDCPGLNAALRAVVRHAERTYGCTMIGIRDGLTGLMVEPTRQQPLNSELVRDIQMLGGTILGTSNKGSPFRDRTQAKGHLDRIERAYDKLRLDGLVVIGGDGTQFMAKQVAQRGMAVVGIPKTIDNDLCGTDLTIGYKTAVEVSTEAAARLKSSADAHNRIMVLEVMGRDAGHIALGTALAAGADMALLPEIPFDPKVVARTYDRSRKTGRDSFLVVVAEGALALGAGTVLTENATGALALGGVGHLVAKILHAHSGVDARVAMLGHVQRGGTPCADDCVLATLFATRAVDLIANGKKGRVVGIHQGGPIDFPYRQITEARRLLDLEGPMVAAAEATGICLGREP